MLHIHSPNSMRTIEINPLPSSMPVGTLPSYWQRRMAVLNPGAGPTELNRREMGQLGYLRTVLKDMARPVIEHACNLGP